MSTITWYRMGLLFIQCAVFGGGGSPGVSRHKRRNNPHRNAACQHSVCEAGGAPKEHTLWMVRGHQAPKRVPAGSFLALDSSTQVLSLSPDGRYVAELLPRTDKIPQSWSQYVPAPRTQDWKVNPTNKQLTSPSNIVALKQYAIIALDTSKVSFLNAPLAESLGYGDGMMARWSDDSRRLLVTNTFLPLDDGESTSVSAHGGNRYPCTARNHGQHRAEYRMHFVGSLSITPPTFRLTNASFTSSADTVQLLFAKGDGTTQREQYRFNDRGWTQSKTANEDADDSTSADHSNGLMVSVKEDLNSPPTLSVTDLATKRSRKLWNPNPQLEHMHFVWHLFTTGRTAPGFSGQEDSSSPWATLPEHAIRSSCRLTASDHPNL